jgi:hypothetical protein
MDIDEPIVDKLRSLHKCHPSPTPSVAPSFIVDLVSRRPDTRGPRATLLFRRDARRAVDGDCLDVIAPIGTRHVIVAQLNPSMRDTV